MCHSHHITETNFSHFKLGWQCIIEEKKSIHELFSVSACGVQCNFIVEHRFDKTNGCYRRFYLARRIPQLQVDLVLLARFGRVGDSLLAEVDANCGDESSVEFPI